MADRDGATHLITQINVDKELEVSFVGRGSNPFSKAILKKSADESTPPTETIEMALKSVALAALMSTAVGTALAKSFTEQAELDTFLAKSDEDQTTDLAAFAKAKAMPWGEDTKTADAKKGADTETEVNKGALEGDAGADAITAAVAKAIEASPIIVALRKENEDLTARLEKQSETATLATLEKRAETEFKGLGLEKSETVSLLKAIDGMDAGVREKIENIFKAHAEMARNVARPVGLANLGKSANSATARLNKATTDLAVKKSISEEEAFVQINSDPDFADLIAQVDAEEHELAA